MDELESQLRRYADAAEQRVPATSTAHPNRSKRGKLLAAAAVVVLLGGVIGAFTLTRSSEDRVDTAPADDMSVDPPLDPCPAPAEEPRPHHLQLEPGSVVGTKVERSNLGSTTASEVFTVFVGFDSEDWFEVRVRELDASTDYLQRVGQGTVTVRVPVCDPFRTDRSPREVTGLLAEGLVERSITFTLGELWSVSLRAAPASESTRTLDDLVAVLAGVTWPAPSDEPTTATSTPVAPDGDCPSNPEVAIEVGSLTVTAIPEGYEPKLPVEIEDSGVPVDLSGESRSSLTLLHPTDGGIQVISFGSPDPATYINERVAIGEVDHVNVRMCRGVGGHNERADHLVTLGRNGGMLAAAAQIWEYEGFLVVGPHTSRDALVEVVAGLRLP